MEKTILSGDGKRLVRVAAVDYFDYEPVGAEGSTQYSVRANFSSSETSWVEIDRYPTEREAKSAIQNIQSKLELEE